MVHPRVPCGVQVDVEAFAAHQSRRSSYPLRVYIATGVVVELTWCIPDTFHESNHLDLINK